MTKKSAFLAISLVVILLLTDHFYPSVVYPDLPFHSVPKEKVASLIKQSPDQLVKITEEHDYAWYGAEFQQGKAVDRLKEALKEAGWTFLKQEGAGYFFVQEKNEMVVTTQMWSRKIILIKVPVSADLHLSEGRGTAIPHQ